MKSVALSGSDTTIIGERSLSDLADQDCVALSFATDLMSVKVGKNGNAIYSFNNTGLVCAVVIRVLRGSSDDKYLNSLLSQMIANPAGFVLLDGEFVKKVGDGKGNITRETYIMSGGVFTRMPDARDSAEGNTDASVSVYNLVFSNAPRAIG